MYTAWQQILQRNRELIASHYKQLIRFLRVERTTEDIPG